MNNTENPETSWTDPVTGDPLPEITIDPVFAAYLQKEEEEIQHYNDYVILCGTAGEIPMAIEEWTDFNKTYQEHVRTAGSPLSAPTFQRLQETPTATESPELFNARQDISKLNVRVKELSAEVSALEDNNASLYTENDKLKHERDLAMKFKRLAEEETTRLGNRLLSEKQSYSDEDYEGLLTVRDDLAKENEKLTKDLEVAHEHIRVVDAENKRLTQQLETASLLSKFPPTPSNQPIFPHYFRQVPNCTHVDVYWALKAWDVTDPCVQHAIKKLMAAGMRGAKNKTKDLQEARDSIARALELEEV